MTVQLICADCLSPDGLPSIPSQSVDAVITDSPYPHIKRDYGKWTTEEWWALMVEGVIPEVRRILKPTGSAVFILQPNSEHVGQMRGWLWEFMAWVCREWNMVQDAYWWNYTSLPVGGAITAGLMRSSIKACVWCGPPNCTRYQENVLWTESDESKYRRKLVKAHPAKYDRAVVYPSGRSVNQKRARAAAERRGGTTPFNVIPAQLDGWRKQGGGIHSAPTPLKLADWWTRYICPPCGTVVDPFDGVGTMMLAALQNGCNGIGIEQVPKYHEIAQKRIGEAQTEMVQLEMAS